MRRQATVRNKSKQPKRTKSRAEALRLSNHGWKVDKIAEYFDWHPQTVREIIQRWRGQGEEGLPNQDDQNNGKKKIFNI